MVHQSNLSEAVKALTEWHDTPIEIQSTKTFTHSVGMSAAFRQWRAESHCRFLHGYSLEIQIVFGGSELDIRNWVVDFGSMKSLKEWLANTFDHKTLVAEDDPMRGWFEDAHKIGILDLVVVPATGCERFAEMIYRVVEIWLGDNGYGPRCWVESVEVREHAANSAIVKRKAA